MRDVLQDDQAERDHTDLLKGEKKMREILKISGALLAFIALMFITGYGE